MTKETTHGLPPNDPALVELRTLRAAVMNQRNALSHNARTFAVAVRLLREARAHLGGAKMSTLARSATMLCKAIDEFVEGQGT